MSHPFWKQAARNRWVLRVSSGVALQVRREPCEHYDLYDCDCHPWIPEVRVVNWDLDLERVYPGHPAASLAEAKAAALDLAPDLLDCVLMHVEDTASALRKTLATLPAGPQIPEL